MRKLLLCEKPSVARDVAKALNVPAQGNGYFVGDGLVITWCIGHLVEHEEPAAYNAAWRRWSWDGLPMLPERFLLRPSKGTVKQWQVVRQMLRREDFHSVVNACDAGREGELIFRYCYALSGSKLPIERLWISSLTPQAITRGFESLRSGRAYDALFAAARCRAEADWLVGLNATRAVTLWRGGKTLLSIGRVQTPTLSLLVTRERDIERFVPRDYFEVEAELLTDGNKRDATPFFARFEHNGKRRFAASDLAQVVADRDGLAPAPWVESVDEKPVREPPPLLFDLGALQRTCNRRYGYSAQQTLQLAQSLYEQHKLLTYPRTDSRYLSKDLVSQLGRTFSALAKNPDYAAFCATLADGKAGAPKRIFQDHKVTDHHAIIPTLVEHTDARIAALSTAERRVLDLVVRRFIGAFYPDAEFRETRAIIRVDAKPTPPAPPAPSATPTADEDYLQITPPVPDRYVAKGRVRVRAGWQEVAGFSETSAARERGGDEANSDENSDEDNEKDRDKGQALPPLSVDMRLRGAFSVLSKKTKPPPRYTEASLLAAMDGAGRKLTDETLRAAMQDHGLGTPATRASIIETLLDRGYVVRRAKLLIPTELGLDLISSLPVPDLCSAELTGNWEARLSQLARGEDSASAFMADIAAYVRKLVAAVHSAPSRPALPAATPSAKAIKSSNPGSTGKTASTRRPTRRAAKADTDAPKSPSRRRKKTEPAAARLTTEKRTRKRAAAPSAKRSVARTFAPPVEISAPSQPPPGTPVEPPLLCPRCKQARILWGRRAWGCANFRDCTLIVPYEMNGQRQSEIDLRRSCAAQRMTDSNGAASVASDRPLEKS